MYVNIFICSETREVCTQPRQTLYYARNDAALANWFTFLQSARAQANYKAIESLICFNTGLLGGACVVVPCKDIPAFRFDEIPLREVMVKADYGTQFKIEYSFWNLLPELNACGDIVTPKSGQLDGGKDSGLPPNGSSPQNGSPNNPYGGLLPADGIDKEGVLSPSKLNNQDNSNPDNAPNFQIDRMATTSQEGYYLELNALSCASLFNISPQRVGNYRWFIPSYSDSRIRVTSNALFDDHTCTRRDLERVYYDIFSPTNGVTLTRTDLLYLPISAEVKYGFLPTNQNFDGVPYP